VALADSVVARRRAYAALTANGVPRGTLSHAVLWQTLGPAVPALLLALISGSAIIRQMGTAGQSSRSGTTSCDLACVEGKAPPTVVQHVQSTGPTVHVPLESLALLGGGIGLLVLRSSTDLAELRV
jgi:hypothetical protein